jgi:hypothetical protein
MTLLETIISGIILSSVSAITWLVYKHPHAYKKIMPILLISSMSLSLSVMAYDMGVIKAFGPAVSIPLFALSLHSYALISCFLAFYQIF